MEKTAIKNIIKSFLESKLFIAVIGLLTVISWQSGVMYLSYILFTALLGLVYAFKANGVSFISLYILLIGGSSVQSYDVKGTTHITQIVLIIVAVIPSTFFVAKDLITNRKEYFCKLKNDGIIRCMLLLTAAMLLTFITTEHYGSTAVYILKYSLNIWFALMVITKVDISDRAQIDNIMFSVGIMVLTIGVEAGLRLIYMKNHLDSMRNANMGGYKIVSYPSLWKALKSKQLGLYWAVSNHWIMITNVGLIMMIYYMVSTKKIWLKVFAGCTIAIAIILAILTRCRGGLFGLAISMVILGYVVICRLNPSKARMFIKLIYVGSAVAFVAIFAHKIGDKAFEEEIFDGILDPNGRNIIYAGGIKVFSDNWLLGTGAGTSKYSIMEILGKNKIMLINYHNCFIQIAATCGIIGIVSFLVYILGCLLRVYKRNMLLASFVGITFVCSFVHGQFDTFFPSSESMVVLTILLCLIPRRQLIKIVKNEEL